MELSNKPPHPNGWGNDTLTQYLETCRGNQFATFANKRSEVIDLTTIDGMFRKLLEGAVNPRPFLPAGFLLRAHSAFLAATGSVLAGQLHEAQALLRACLEQGGYAHFIGDDHQRWERWMNRHESPDSTKIVRREFHHTKICECLAVANTDLGGVYSILYDRTIEFGAHPNVHGASLGSSVEDTEDDGLRLLTFFLHAEGPKLDFALRTAAQVGICVMRIAQLIYPTRMQATGVQVLLETISKRF